MAPRPQGVTYFNESIFNKISTQPTVMTVLRSALTGKTSQWRLVNAMGDQAKTLKPMPQHHSGFSDHGHRLVRRLRTYYQAPASDDRARTGASRVKTQRFDETLKQGRCKGRGRETDEKDRSRQRQ